MPDKQSIRNAPNNLSRLMRVSGWDVAVAQYFAKSRAGFVQISELLNAKRFTVKDSGSTHRLIGRWTDNELIEDDSRNVDEGWRRLSFLDLIWIRAMVEMRKFGLSLDLLKIARHAIFQVPGKPEAKRIEFEYAVAHCLSIEPTNFMIVVFSDGHAEIIDGDNFDMSRSIGFLDHDSYLIVGLNQLCKSLLPNTEIPEFRFNVDLTDQEQQVIESLRSGQYDVVEIYRRGGKVDRIKGRSTSNRAAKNLDELARSIEFGEFTVKVQKGKAVLTQVTESKTV